MSAAEPGLGSGEGVPDLPRSSRSSDGWQMKQSILPTSSRTFCRATKHAIGPSVSSSGEQRSCCFTAACRSSEVCFMSSYVCVSASESGESARMVNAREASVRRAGSASMHVTCGRGREVGKRA